MENKYLEIDNFNFELPQNLIAQKPFFPKNETPMLHFNSKQKIVDRKITHLLNLLKKGDVLVFNNAKVIKAQLSAINCTNNAIISFNLDQPVCYDNLNLWKALCKPAKKVNLNDRLVISNNFSAIVKKKLENGKIEILFEFNQNNISSIFEALELYGSIPIPPYVKNLQEVKNYYQNTFASNGFAVAAPTAGLHFDQEILLKLQDRGIITLFATLNVGAGTFLPVKTKNITQHEMHQEYFSIDSEACHQINLAKQEKRRVIAVGTTSLRLLESCFLQAKKENSLEIRPFSGNTNIFIYPGYKFGVVDALITNFHLPKSTLFMLICAFIGTTNAHNLYSHAIENSYRFYSFGDACFLEKHCQ